MTEFDDDECGICNKPIKSDEDAWEWSEELAHMECVLRISEQICTKCGYLTTNNEDKCGDCGGKLRKLTEKDKQKFRSDENAG